MRQFTTMEENPWTKSELLAWSDGRRIVDLCELSKQLHCRQCSSLLDLQRTEMEARYGLASVLYILCHCGVMNDVHTGRTLHGNQRNCNHSDSEPVFEVNVKAAENLQMYAASASCILSFLALLDVPVSDHHDCLLPTTPQPHSPQYTTHVCPTSGLPPTHIPSAFGPSPTHTPPTSSPPPTHTPPTSGPSPTHTPPTSVCQGQSLCSEIFHPSYCLPSPSSHHCVSEVGPGYQAVPSLSDSVSLSMYKGNDIGGGDESCEGGGGGRLGHEESKGREDSEGTRSPSVVKVRVKARKSLTTRRYMSRKACTVVNVKVKAEPPVPAEENGSARNDERPTDAFLDDWQSSDSEEKHLHSRDSDASWHEEEEKRSRKKRKSGQGQPRVRVRKARDSAATEKEDEEKEREGKKEVNLPNRCSACGKGFSSPRGCGLHYRRVHGQQKRKPQQDSLELQTHQQEVPGAEPGQVKEGEAVVEEEEAQTREVMQEVTGQMFRCPRCPAVFSDPKGYFGHSERRHTGLEDEEKGKVFPVTIKGSIIRKTRLCADGSEKKTYQCLHCGRCLSTTALLASHLRVAQDDRLSCVVVTPLGVRVRAKTVELSIGREEHRPCLCSMCGKVYANSTSLSTHVKEVHAQKKKFSCHLCSAAFTRPGSLQYHLGTHQRDRDRPCVCSTCGKSFFTAAHLKYHMRKQHRNAPPLLCHVCGKAFYTTRTLKDHTVIHTGQRNFPCPDCPMSFYKKYNLTVHQRIHSGHRPYCCPLCPLSFAQKHSLDYHMSKHGATAATSAVVHQPTDVVQT